MEYLKRSLKVPELFTITEPHGNNYIEYHEAGHALLYCLSGLIPSYVTVTSNKADGGHVSAPCYFYDVIPPEEVPGAILSLHMAGIVGAAYNCGWYDWTNPVRDMEVIQAAIVYYSLPPAEVLRIWMQLHETIEKHADLLTEIAEKLTADKHIDAEYFEEILFRN